MDPSKVLQGWKLDEKISKLEEKISDLDKIIKEQVKSKRREADEPESSHKAKSQDLKRARLADSRPHVNHIERNLLDGGIPQYSTTYSAYSSVAGPAARIRVAEVMSPGSYATSIPGGILVDRVGQISNHSSSVQPYGWRGEASLDERLVSRSYVEPSAHGVSSLYRAHPQRWKAMRGCQIPHLLVWGCQIPCLVVFLIGAQPRIFTSLPIPLWREKHTLVLEQVLVLLSPLLVLPPPIIRLTITEGIL